MFGRSVVLMVHHDDESAQGLILNRPTLKAVDDVLPGWQELATEPACLYQGGPVGLDSALGLVSVPGDVSDVLGIRILIRGLGVVDLDAPTALIAPEISGLRVFAGFSGWGAGQLEAEVAGGHWYVGDAEARDPFTDEPEHLWSTVLRRQAGNLAFVSTFPDDPSMN